MLFKLVTATLNIDMLEKVEERLRSIGVPGISVSETKGYGVYKQFFHRDWLTTHARIQIYAPENHVNDVVKAIMDAAHTGLEDDGIIVVSPVETIYRIKDKTQLSADAFNAH
ncbi:MAG: P-II family nitrogen regulator [Pseudomonadota bacterium]